MPSLPHLFERLSLAVLERGWLSSNNVVFKDRREGATVIDTGYASHAEQTVALIAAHLGSEPLARVLNTHLHSDHCGGNAALHAWGRCRISVPCGNFASAATWDDQELTFQSTGQRCDRFPVHEALQHGTSMRLGLRSWQIHSAPGHDPNAVMFFEPQEGVLISGDALWQHGIAILFPEFVGGEGFVGALRALDAIERLAPNVVIPGHGAPFIDVESAVLQSRERIYAYERHPEKHRNYSGRALVMFHMLEHRRRRRTQLVAWACSTRSLKQIAPSTQNHVEWLDDLVDHLIFTGALKEYGEEIYVP
jgi:glyoxylase-like metal-dependent hydrolase (beta-lactamase superfamily II)